MIPSNKGCGLGVLGIVMLITGISEPAMAAQPETAKRQALRQDAKKPVTAAASSQPARRRPTQGKPWSIEDALPKNSSAVSQPAGDASAGSAAGLGRMRAGQGTFGFETETKFKANELPDGRPVPAPSQNAHQSSQYLGLSLSVPTLDKSIIPLAPFWGRSE